MFSEFDRLAMTRALVLAERGLETTHPNPRVGCVIAKGDRIIAEGFHERAGEAHAEVAALRAAKEPVAGATVYVTLEPCSHHGRTPPCVNALIEARVARVVFAVQDPNPQVSGQGAEALLRAGIAVEAGLMEAETTELNIGFMKRMKHGLPWVRVKLAMSLDGRTALANGASQWITGEASRFDVQRWRARCSAVMTGVGTVLADDPQLNVRAAGFKGRQPLRVVLDSFLRSPPGAKVFTPTAGAAAALAKADALPTGGVIVFTAIRGGTPVAAPAAVVAADEAVDVGDDMADLVKAFESLPSSVTAKTDGVSGAVSVKSERVSAPAVRGATGGGGGASLGAGAVVADGGRIAADTGPIAAGAGTVAASVGSAAGAAATQVAGAVATASATAAAPPLATAPVVSQSAAAGLSSAAPPGESSVGASKAPAPLSSPKDGTTTGGGAPAVAAQVAPAPGQPAAQAAPATSLSDDATWAGAALSGAVQVGHQPGGAPAGALPSATSPVSTSAPKGGVAPAGGPPPSNKGSAATRSGPPTPPALDARRDALVERGVRVEEVPSDEGFLDLLSVFQRLAQLEVNEVLVEAGPTLAGQLLTTFFADELLLYVAPKLLGPQGRPLVNLPELQSLQDAWGFALFDAKRFGDDLRLRFRPK